MEDVRDLKELQIDALREVANIGAGHAATALSQLTNRRIMISVPQINIARLEEVPNLLGHPQEVVAAVLMHMLGDLTGRTLLLFPESVGRRLCDMRSEERRVGKSVDLGGRRIIKKKKKRHRRQE